MNKFLSVFGGLMLCFVSSLYSKTTWAQLTTVNLNPTQDAQLSSKFPSSPNGSSTTFNVGYDASSLIRRGAVKFDLSSIPSNATVLSAHLYFKPKSSLPNLGFTNTRLSKYLASWAESSITYANAPAVDGSGISTSVGESGWRKFEVTTDVKGFVDGSYPNNGWQLRMSNETANASFDYYSREYSTTSFRPYLVVKYYYPIIVTAASIGHVSEITETDGSINPTIAGGSGNYTYEWINGSSGNVIATSSTLSGVGYGWYGLHISDATYDIESYMAFLVGTECSSVTIDFKPGPEYVDDAQLYNLNKDGVNNGNLNFGDNIAYITENWTNGGSSYWYNRKNLVKFNLWVDDDFQFDMADLYLYGNGHNPFSRSNISELRYVTNPWEESVVTYNTAPSFGTTPNTTIPGTSTADENKVLDISEFWELWKTDNSANYGMMMQLQSYTNSHTRMWFHSSDATTPANRPWIQFEVNLGGQGDCPNLYAKIERELKGVKYDVYGDKLYFYYDNEYQNQQTDLTYRIFSSMDRVSPVQIGTQNPVDLKYGDNRYQLDVSSLSAGSYILEVENDKKEKFYLRFIK